MHVGVCMRIEANSMEDAQNQARNILIKYSQEEIDIDLTVEIPIKKFFKHVLNIQEMDDDAMALYCETIDLKEPFLEFLSEEFTERGFYELDDSNEVIKIIRNELSKNHSEDELDSLWLGEIYEEDIGFIRNIYEHVSYIILRVSGVLNKGLWDYDYGTTESFGEPESDTFRIYSGHCDENLNHKFLKELFQGNEKCTEVVDYWIDYVMNLVFSPEYFERNYHGKLQCSK